MAFQGTQQPDLIGLALNLMQMRRQNELNDRRLALDEFKAKADAEAAREKGRLEAIKLGREMAGSAATAGASLGPSLATATDQGAPAEDQAAAARAYLAGLQQEAQFRAGPGMRVTGDILNQVGNEAASSNALARSASRAEPKLDWEYDKEGNKRRVIVGEGGKMTPVPGAVWVPPKAGVTVNVGGKDGLDLNQVATASRAERDAFRQQMVPFESFDRARTTMRNVRKMADENGILPQAASQIIASDAMAALRPEALNEGDVARLTQVGIWNKALARIGLPPQMTVEQLDTLAKMINDKAREAEPKRRAIIKDARKRAKYFGFPPDLILGEYTDGIPSLPNTTPSAGSNGSVRIAPGETNGGTMSVGPLTPSEAKALGLE